MFKSKITKVDGITLIYEKNKSNKASTVIIGVKQGSFSDKNEGTAHFFEHMMFHETKNRSEEQLSKDIAQNILNLNATTGYSKMQIEFSNSSRKLENAFEIACDMLLNSIFTKEKIDNERQVIIQEIIRNENNNNETNRFLNFRARTGYSRKTTGTIKSVKNINAKVLEQFRSEKFCKNSVYVSVCSDKSIKVFKKLIKKYLSTNLATNSNYVYQDIDNLPINKNAKVEIKAIPASSKNIIRLNFATDLCVRENSPKLRFIDSVFYELKSRVFKAFRDENQLV